MAWEDEIKSFCNLGDWPGAIAAAHRNCGETKSAAPILLLAQLQWQAGQPGAAAASYVEAVEKFADRQQRTFRVLMSLNYEIGNYADVVRVGPNGLELFPDDSAINAYLGLGENRLQGGGNGLERARRGLALDPEHFGPFYRDFPAAMAKAGRDDDAANDLEAAIRTLRARSANSDALASARLRLAELLHRLKRQRELQSVLTELILQRPDLIAMVAHMLPGNMIADSMDKTALADAAAAMTSRILDLLAGEQISSSPPPPAGTLFFYSLSCAYVNANDKSSTSQALFEKAGICSAFLDVARSGADKLARATRQRDDAPSWHGDSGVSERVKDVLDTLQTRAKRLLSPFSGQVVTSQHMIADECFLLRDGPHVCLALQLSEADTTFTETAWYFPAEQLVVYLPESRVPVSAIAKVIERIATRLMTRSGEYQRYLAQAPARIGVAEYQCPHIGHYIWNCISGWEPFFRHGGDRLGVDFYMVHAPLKMLGGVGELYPEHVASAPGGIKELLQGGDYADLILDGAMVLTVRARHVSEGEARRVTAWAYRHCSAEFLGRVKKLRDAASPLCLITIRLDNRCWMEQESGFIELLRALRQDYAGFGVIIDGINTGIAQGWTHALMSVEAEKKIAAAITQACEDRMPLYDSIGCTVAESIVLADHADFFIAPVGAGMAKYRWIANLPGVAFSNKSFSTPGSYHGHLYDHFRDDAQMAWHVGPEAVRDVEVRHGTDSRSNFSMDWRELYAVAAKFVSDWSRRPRAMRAKLP